MRPEEPLLPRELFDSIDATLARIAGDLVALRRDLHAHPELAWSEHRTTNVLRERLDAAGIEVRPLGPTGLVCDLPGGAEADGGARPSREDPHVYLHPAGERRCIGLRADIDALPVTEETGLPYASLTPGVSHACGHDVHTTAVLGAGLALAELAAQGLLPAPVRLVFQPAEEVQPGGAEAVIAAGVLEGVESVFALHCDPKIEVGTIGSRVGSITSASDPVRVTIRSHGGHTSRPYLTGDVVHALGEVIVGAGAVLGRRIDPRAGVNLTWGAVNAGSATNAIPTAGTLQGTLRVLDVAQWEHAGEVLDAAIEQIVAPYGVEVEVHHALGVPPTVNEAHAVEQIEAAARDLLGGDAVHPTEQSLGGEDFGWYLRRVPGAMVRLGTGTPGEPPADLHRADLRIDERAIGIGAAVLARTAVLAGFDGRSPSPR